MAGNTGDGGSHGGALQSSVANTDEHDSPLGAKAALPHGLFGN
jgi:hypothetical protein